MIFPDSPRVIYDKNPLHEVICQIRFPTILRIASEPPTEFQESLRGRFPLFSENRQATLQLPNGIERVLPTELTPKTEVAYELTSDNEAWTVSLTPSFLALTCREYSRWESFKEWLTLPLQALEKTYTPPFITRIGLRYQDIIRRSMLDLDTSPWQELLSKSIAAELADRRLSQRISHVAREFRVKDDSGSEVQVRHGFVQHKESGEQCYLIDADFFTEERVKHEQIVSKLDRFHRDAGRLFRWCITPRLHAAMGPSRLD